MLRGTAELSVIRYPVIRLSARLKTENIRRLIINYSVQGLSNRNTRMFVLMITAERRQISCPKYRYSNAVERKGALKTRSITTLQINDNKFIIIIFWFSVL